MARRLLLLGYQTQVTDFLMLLDHLASLSYRPLMQMSTITLYNRN